MTGPLPLFLDTTPTTVKGSPCISMVRPTGFSPVNRLRAVLLSNSATLRRWAKSEAIKPRP